MDYAELSPVDLALACLQGGDQAAWAEFIRRFNPLIAGIVVKIARKWGESSPQACDDLIQETYLKLCADRSLLLARFDPAHSDSIFGFIKVFTANVVHDHFRSQHTKKRGAGVTTDLVTEFEGEAESKSPHSNAKAIELKVLFGEIDTFLRNSEAGPTGERDRRIFWLYYRLGLTAAAISASAGIGLSTKGVESTILRLTKRVRVHMTGAAVRDRIDFGPSPGKVFDPQTRSKEV